MPPRDGAGLSVAELSQFPPMPASPYEGGKKKRHFTISDTAYEHLSLISESASLSRSETLERLIRSVPVWEGGFSLSDNAWKECIDFTSDDSFSPSSVLYDID